MTTKAKHSSHISGKEERSASPATKHASSPSSDRSDSRRYGQEETDYREEETETPRRSGRRSNRSGQGARH